MPFPSLRTRQNTGRPNTGSGTTNQLRLRLRNTPVRSRVGMSPVAGLPLRQQRLSPPSRNEAGYTYNPEYTRNVNLGVAETGNFEVQPQQRLQIGETNNFTFTQERSPFTFASSQESIAPQRHTLTLTPTQSIQRPLDDTELNKLRANNQALRQQNQSLQSSLEVQSRQAEASNLLANYWEKKAKPKPLKLRFSGTQTMASVEPTQRPVLSMDNSAEFQRNEQRPTLSMNNQAPMTIRPTRSVLQMSEFQVNQAQPQRNNFSLTDTSTQEISPERRTPTLQINGSTEFERNEREQRLQRTSTTHADVAPRQGPALGIQANPNLDIGVVQKSKLSLSEAGGVDRGIRPSILGTSAPQMHETQPMPQLVSSKIQTTAPSLRLSPPTGNEVKQKLPKLEVGNETEVNFQAPKLRLRRQISGPSVQIGNGVVNSLEANNQALRQQNQSLQSSLKNQKLINISNEALLNTEAKQKEQRLLRLRLNPVQITASIPPKQQASFSLDSTHEDIAPNKPKLSVTRKFSYNNPLDESELNSYKASNKKNEKTIAHQKGTISQLQKENKGKDETVKEKEKLILKLQTKLKQATPSPKVSYATTSTETTQPRMKSVGTKPIHQLTQPKYETGSFGFSHTEVADVEPWWEVDKRNTGDLDLPVGEEARRRALLNPLRMHRSTRKDTAENKKKVLKNPFSSGRHFAVFGDYSGYPYYLTFSPPGEGILSDVRRLSKNRKRDLEYDYDYEYDEPKLRKDKGHAKTKKKH